MSSLKDSFSGLAPRIWILAGVNFLNRCGSLIVSFLSLYITQSLHYSIVEAGYAMSCYGLGAIAGQQIGGYLTDRLGYHKVQLLTLVSNGFAVFWLMQIRSFEWLCIVLFVLNLTADAFRPANSVAIRMNSTDETRTRSFSLLRVAFNLAIAIALTLGGWLVTLDWNYIFWADGLTCFVAATVLFFMPEVKNTQTTQAPTNSTEKEIPLSPYKDKQYMIFVLSTFLGALAFMQIIWTLPTFFKSVYHWDEFRIGCVSAVNGFLVMFVEMPLVHRIEKKPLLKLVRLGIILYAVAYLVFILPASFKWFAALFYMVTISFGEILVMPFSTTWAMKKSPPKQEGKYMAVYGMAYACANVVAPLMGTQIIYYLGYDVLWLTIALICVLAWFLFLRLESSESLATA